jgi:hypothetical protein
MQIKALGSDRQSQLKGNVVNVECDLDVCAEVIPLSLEETSTLQVKLMRRIADPSYYMYEVVRPFKVYHAAKYLEKTDLYISNNVKLSEKWSKCDPSK